MAADNTLTLLLRSFLGPVQDVEDALSQLLVDRAVDTAIGTQLDVIGKIVGEARDGRTDDLYRLLVRARIAANRSTGITEHVIRVADLVVYDDAAEFVVTTEGPAAYTIRVDDVVITNDIADILIGLLRDATSAGVRAISKTGTTAQATRFAFDGAGPGLDDGAFIDARD